MKYYITIYIYVSQSELICKLTKVCRGFSSGAVSTFSVLTIFTMQNHPRIGEQCPKPLVDDCMRWDFTQQKLEMIIILGSRDSYQLASKEKDGIGVFLMAQVC